MTIKPQYWEQAKKDLSNADPIMGKIITLYKGEALQSRGDAFNSLMRSIVGQQISVKAASSIWQKIEVNFEISPAHLLKTDEELLRRTGLSKQKVLYIKSLAEYFSDNHLKIIGFHELSDDEIITELIKIKGIGKWTAEMFLIFHMLRPNVFPIKDIGLQKAIIKHYVKGNKLSNRTINKLSKTWSPWRSVATWYLWRSLDPLPVEY